MRTPCTPLPSNWPLTLISRLRRCSAALACQPSRQGQRISFSSGAFLHVQQKDHLYHPFIDDVPGFPGSGDRVAAKDPCTKIPFLLLAAKAFSSRVANCCWHGRSQQNTYHLSFLPGPKRRREVGCSFSRRKENAPSKNRLYIEHFHSSAINPAR